MTNARHMHQTPVEGVHTPFAWTFANSAARIAFTPLTGAPVTQGELVADDLDRVGFQIDDGSMWRLTATTPTWQQIAAAATDPKELVLHAQKGTAGTIGSGKVVYITGFDTGDDVVEVELAQSNAAGTMSAIGIVRSSVAQSSSGTVVMYGEVSGVDTSSFTEGDRLYVSDTVAGELVATPPTGTGLIQEVGQVVRSHPSLGVIAVTVTAQEGLPNLPTDNVWVGNGSSVPTATSRDGIDNTAFHDNVSGEIDALTEKVTPDDDDVLVLENSANSFGKNKVKVGNLVGTPPPLVFPFAYSETTSTSRQYVPLVGTSESSTISALHVSALIPYDCELKKVIFCSSDSDMDDTDVTAHKGTAGAIPSTTPVETQTIDADLANTSYTVNFTATTYAEGDRIAIGIDPTLFPMATRGVVILEAT